MVPFRDRHGLLVRVRLWHFVCDMTHLRKGIVRIASAVDDTFELEHEK